MLKSFDVESAQDFILIEFYILGRFITQFILANSYINIIHNCNSYIFAPLIDKNSEKCSMTDQTAVV